MRKASGNTEAHREPTLTIADKMIAGIQIATAGRQQREFVMWKWFNCYLSGGHDFGVWCESGTIYLRCLHCGKRSSGWAVRGQQPDLPPMVAHSPDVTHGQQPSSRVARFPAQNALR